MSEFEREALRDFSRPADLQAMGHALASVSEQLDQSYPNLVAGERTGAEPGAPLLRTFVPGRPDQVASRFPDAGASGSTAGARAFAFAAERAPVVAAVPEDRRRAALARAAAALRTRRSEFAAWLCFESGFEWAEADEETAAAIDFLRAHAEGTLPVRPVTWPAGVRVDGATNGAPDRGPVVVAGDEALPLAGPAAALAAAHAAGRPAVFVPAPPAATVGWKLAELLAEACGDEDGNDGALQFMTAMSANAAFGPETSRTVTWWRRPAHGRAPVAVHASGWTDDVAQRIVRAAFARGGRRPFAPDTVFAEERAAEEVEASLLRALAALVRGPAIDAVTERADHHAAPSVRREGPPPREHELVVRGVGGPDSPWTAVASDDSAAGPVWVLCTDEAEREKARSQLGARARLNRSRAPLSFVDLR